MLWVKGYRRGVFLRFFFCYFTFLLLHSSESWSVVKVYWKWLNSLIERFGIFAIIKIQAFNRSEEKKTFTIS